MSADTHPAEPAMLRAWPSRELGGRIEVPGDKSMSHRALIFGAMADGESWIDGLLESDDVMRTASAVRAFGAEVDRASHGRWRVIGARWQSPGRPIDCGNSGTSARLLMGAAAGQRLEAGFTGDASLCRRPMNRVIDPLRQMGASIDADGSGLLPLTVSGGRLSGIRFENRFASAQVKSAILLAGLSTSHAVEIVEPCPSRYHSEIMLCAFGCDIRRSQGRVRLGTSRTLNGARIGISGDPSSAAFPLVAALIVPGSEVTVRSVVVNPLRIGLYRTLADMGADLTFSNRRMVGGEEVADLTARASRLKGVDVPASRSPSMIDEFPILAVAAAFAEGRTVMRGVGELRVKESDRQAALVDGLLATGCQAFISGDSLVVEGCGGPPAGGASIAAHGDHRIAMSFLTMGLGARAPIETDSSQMIATSFPDFAGLMRSIGADLR